MTVYELMRLLEALPLTSQVNIAERSKMRMGKQVPIIGVSRERSIYGAGTNLGVQAWILGEARWSPLPKDVWAPRLRLKP